MGKARNKKKKKESDKGAIGKGAKSDGGRAATSHKAKRKAGATKSATPADSKRTPVAAPAAPAPAPAPAVDDSLRWEDVEEEEAAEHRRLQKYKANRRERYLDHWNGLLDAQQAGEL